MARKPKTVNPGGPMAKPVPKSAETKAQKAGHVKAGKTTHARHVAELKKLNQQRAKHHLPALTHIPEGTAVSHSHPRKAMAPENSATGDWIMAYNDEADTCVAAALANSLLVCTGRCMQGEDLLALCRMTEAYDIYMGLVTMMEMELDVGPRGFCPVYPVRTLGLVLGLQTPGGPHAVAVGHHGLITWGAEVQLTDYVVEEAWLIDWPAKERT